MHRRSAGLKARRPWRIPGAAGLLRFWRASRRSPSRAAGPSGRWARPRSPGVDPHRAGSSSVSPGEASPAGLSQAAGPRLLPIWACPRRARAIILRNDAAYAAGMLERENGRREEAYGRNDNASGRAEGGVRAAGDPRGSGARIRAGVRARGRGLRGGFAEGRRHLRDTVVQQPRAHRRRLQRVHDRDARRPARHRLLHGPRQRRAAKRQVLLRRHLERRQLRHRDLLRRMGQRRHERAAALPEGGLVHLVAVRPDRARQGLGQQLHHGRQRLLLARGRRLRRVRQLGRRERPHRRRRDHDHQRFRLRALRLPRRRVLFRAGDHPVPRLCARRLHLPGRRRLGLRRAPLRRPGLGRPSARISPERPDRLQDRQGRLRGQHLHAPGRRFSRKCPVYR